MSFKRIVNTPPRKIGNTSVQKFLDYCQYHTLSPLDGGSHIDAMEVRNPGRDALKFFFTQLGEIKKFSQENNVRKTIDFLLEKIAYDEYLSENFSPPEHEARNDNIAELKNLASRYDEHAPEESLMHFLEDIALITDQDQADDTQRRVILMTAHSAK